MSKSSSSNGSPVKVSVRQREQILDVLTPDIKAIVRDGVEQFIGSGTRFLLELLMHAEARQLCGERNNKASSRRNVRWGTEQGTAIMAPSKRYSVLAFVSKGTSPKAPKKLSCNATEQ